MPCLAGLRALDGACRFRRSPREEHPARSTSFVAVNKGIVHDYLRPLRVKTESHLMNALLAHGLADSGLMRRLAIEQQKSSATGARDFSSESTAMKRHGVQLIDAGGGDLVRDSTLGLPCFVQQFPKVMQLSLFETVEEACARPALSLRAGPQPQSRCHCEWMLPARAKWSRNDAQRRQRTA